MTKYQRLKTQLITIQDDLYDVITGEGEISQSEYDSLLLQNNIYHLALTVLDKHPAAISLPLGEFIKAIDLHIMMVGIGNRSYRATVAMHALELIRP